MNEIIAKTSVILCPKCDGYGRQRLDDRFSDKMYGTCYYCDGKGRVVETISHKKIDWDLE
jgi:DnaJ-class molecular chaperone